MADVVVVGNAGLDTIVFIDADAVDLTADSQFTRNVDVVGQAGAYCSRGFARLGRSTRFLGALGDDSAGAQVRAALTADGVDVTGAFTDPTGTARSVNLVTRDGSRRAFYDGRGHMSLQPPVGVARRTVAGARLVHVHLPNWARQILPIVTEVAPGAVVSVDLQDMRDVDDPYRRDFIDAADILFFSAANLADPVGAAAQLLQRGQTGGQIRDPAQRQTRVVVVGMGAAGVLTASLDHGIRRHPTPPADLPVVDTNGAGDGLATGFLDAYVLDGADLDQAVLRGQLAARWTCARVGGDDLIDRSSLLSLSAAAT